jgi:hypothetical protein
LATAAWIELKFGTITEEPTAFNLVRQNFDLSLIRFRMKFRIFEQTRIFAQKNQKFAYSRQKTFSPRTKKSGERKHGLQEDEIVMAYERQIFI